MKKKAITILSEREEEFHYEIQIEVYENGSFGNKGTFFRLHEKRRHQRRKGEGLPHRVYQQRSDAYNKAVRSDGCCLICGCYDCIDILEQHHPDKKKMPNFTISLCPNCHRRVHLYFGKNLSAAE